MKSIQPINDNLLIKMESADEEKTAGGIYIPDTAKEKPLQGEVMGISPDLESPIAVGDIVMFKKFSGTALDLDGDNYLILPIDDVLAKVVDVDSIPD